MRPSQSSTSAASKSGEFDRPDMVGPVDHGEGGARIALQDLPGVAVADGGVLAAGDDQRRPGERLFRRGEVEGKAVARRIGAHLGHERRAGRDRRLHQVADLGAQRCRDRPAPATSTSPSAVRSAGIERRQQRLVAHQRLERRQRALAGVGDDRRARAAAGRRHAARSRTRDARARDRRRATCPPARSARPAARVSMKASSAASMSSWLRMRLATDRPMPGRSG